MQDFLLIPYYCIKCYDNNPSNGQLEIGLQFSEKTPKQAVIWEGI